MKNDCIVTDVSDRLQVDLLIDPGIHEFYLLILRMEEKIFTILNPFYLY